MRTSRDALFEKWNQHRHLKWCKISFESQFTHKNWTCEKGIEHTARRERDIASGCKTNMASDIKAAFSQKIILERTSFIILFKFLISLSIIWSKDGRKLLKELLLNCCFNKTGVNRETLMERSWIFNGCWNGKLISFSVGAIQSKTGRNYV